MEPQVWQVVVQGAVVGQVALVARADELAVDGATLVDPRHTGVLRALLDCRALSDGAASVVLDVAAGTASALADVAAEGYDEASVRMALELGPDPTPGGAVRLAPMGQEAFALFREVLAQDYAEERARSGESAERATEVMQAQLADLLPEGLESAGQHLFTAWADGTAVGHLWVALREGTAFVYFVEIVPEQRRRGHGAALVREAARWAREQGATRVALHVFGHNTAARALYAGLGYTATGTTYRRVVGG